MLGKWIGVPFLIFLSSRVEAYKPVVIVHGIFDHKHTLDSLKDRITLKHPGTNVTVINKLHGWKSVTPLWYQVNSFNKVLGPINDENPGGIHLIGFSQGGLVARGMIQSRSNHNIHNFISLSSPQGGQYGDSFLHMMFPNKIKNTVWKLFYSQMGQDISIANYWRDPHHIALFLNHSSFLAKVDLLVETPQSAAFKANFVRLKKLVLIGGPQDGIICPWQSSHFAFYNKNETVVEMRNRVEYERDLFGLKTLDKQKKIITWTVPGVHHLQWHRNLSVIDNYILPYLD